MSVKVTTPFANASLGGVKTALTGCFINFYEGSQPSGGPAAAATGTLCGTATLDADGTTGLAWDTVANGILAKPSTAIWGGEWSVNGTIGWCRIYEASDTSPESADATKVRMDMDCTRTGTTECILSTLTAVLGTSFTINSAVITQPLSK